MWLLTKQINGSIYTNRKWFRYTIMNLFLVIFTIFWCKCCTWMLEINCDYKFSYKEFQKDGWSGKLISDSGDEAPSIYYWQIIKKFSIAITGINYILKYIYNITLLQHYSVFEQINVVLMSIGDTFQKHFYFKSYRPHFCSVQLVYICVIS